MSWNPLVKFVPETADDHLAIDLVRRMHEELKATMNTERSQKTTIGISEIGDPCTRCLCRKLAEIPQPPSMYSDGWKAQIGTFAHAGIEQHFIENYARPDSPFVVGGRRLEIHLEERVTVLQRPDLTLDGSCDFYATDGASFGLVSDWKFQGGKSLTESQKGKIKPVYVVQGHTYGLGWELKGFPVTHVTLYAVPRDGDLKDVAAIIVPYNRQIAVDALARVTALLDARAVLEQAFPGEGWDRLIRAQDTASGCFTCRAYDNAEGKEFFAWANQN